MSKIESAYKEMIEDVQMSWLMMAYCMKDKALELERELAAVTEQRDRLAEAIRKHKASFPFAPDFCDVELYEALAAVKGGSDEL